MLTEQYHLGELALLRDVQHPKRILPVIQERHRRILDVGCGAGQTLLANGSLHAGTVVGVDTDADALRLGKRLTGNIGFVSARGEQLPFPDASFDLVVCRVALPYMHIATAVREMSRVLDTDGELWVTVHALSKVLAELRDGLSRRDAKHVLMQCYVLSNGALLHWTGRDFALPFRPGRRESFQTETGMRRALARAGFSDIFIDRSDNAFVVQARKAAFSPAQRSRAQEEAVPRAGAR